MNRPSCFLSVASFALLLGICFGETPHVDSKAFIEIAVEAEKHREGKMVSEAEFAEMAKDPTTVVLDTRSRRDFAKVHARGAINLPFTEINPGSLKRAIPSKATRVLIYCANNFKPEPIEPGEGAYLFGEPGDTALTEEQKAAIDKLLAEATDEQREAAEDWLGTGPIIREDVKSAPMALNVTTFITLFGYGYRNVFELEPQVDPKASKIGFVSVKP